MSANRMITHHRPTHIAPSHIDAMIGYFRSLSTLIHLLISTPLLLTSLTCTPLLYTDLATSVSSNCSIYQIASRAPLCTCCIYG